MNTIKISAPDTPIFKSAEKIAGTIRCANGRCYFVGGFVRNLLLGRPCKDIDIVSDLTPQQIIKLFPDAQTAGASFGVVIVRSGDFNFEIATMREERFYMDGRHPQDVRYTNSAEIDSARRDFTVNAMYFEPEKRDIFDFHNGIGDLHKGILRTVGNADKRFNEDYLRLLRAVRFAAKYDLQIEQETWASICRNAHLCTHLAAERVLQELDWMFEIRSAHRALDLLDRSGILKHILPEVHALHGVEQPPQWHPEGDVFIHTMNMLRRMAYPSKDMAWSIILHDIGKKPCFTEHDGRIHFYGHESIGAGMAEKRLEALRMSVTRKKRISTLVRDHMRFVQVGNMKEATLRKLLGREDLPLLMELNRLDSVCSSNDMTDWLFMLQKLSSYSSSQILPPPAISGKDLLKMGCTPSPEFRKILDFLYEKQLSGKKIDFQSAFDLIKKHFPCILNK